MAKKKVFGICHLCGTEGKLSFEHVPPKVVFNDSAAIQMEFEDSLKLDRSGIKGKKIQKGAGAYTLCEQCNNDTGAWYARYYAQFCFQAMRFIVSNNGTLSLSYPYHIYPLRVIKQIIAMVASVDGDHFYELDPELTTFVLDRERRHMHPKYRVFLYLNLEGAQRRVGRGMVSVDLYGSGQIKQVVEASHLPFGFVFTADGTRPSNQLVEITHFARYEYDEYDTIQLQLPSLPTHLGIPLDYRGRDEIEEHVRRSRQDYPDSTQ